MEESELAGERMEGQDDGEQCLDSGMLKSHTRLNTDNNPISNINLCCLFIQM